MAVLNVLITSTDNSIADYNDEVMLRGDGRDAIRGLINFLKAAISGKQKNMTIELTSRDTDVVVSTSGTGSLQETKTLG